MNSNHDHHNNIAFEVLVAIATLAFIFLVADLYKAIVWAGILAILTNAGNRTVYERLGRRPNLAAGVSVALVTLLIVLPAIMVGSVIAAQVINLLDDLQSGSVDLSGFAAWLSSHLPGDWNIDEAVGEDLSGLDPRVSDVAVSGGAFVASKVVALLQGMAKVGFLLLVSLYLLFFFLRDGQQIRDAILHATPIRTRRKELLFQKIEDTTAATVKGIVLMGLIQGFLAGVAFLMLGIPNAFLGGFATAIASVIPAIGTAIVWLPVAIFLYVTGEWVKGTILMAFGVIVIGLVDNLLRPIIVGRDSRIPDWIVLISTLGGLAIFGLTGFVLGPLIAGVALVSWQIYGREIAPEGEE